MKKLRVMTWNIHRAIGLDRRYRIGRIVDVIRHHQPDLVLLQEVDHGVPRSHRHKMELEIAHALEYPWHTWAQAHTLKEGSYGNSTLSKFPITKRRVIDLTQGNKKKRNSLYVKIKVPGSPRHLHTFNWHLGLSATERHAQVIRLFRSGTYKKIRPKEPLLLAGDTNDWRNLLFHSSGIQTEGFHAWSEHRRRQHIRTFPSPSPVGALDKIFWRGNLHQAHLHASKVKVTRVASDHLPLLAEFHL